MTVGFVGLGTMGAPMAGHLVSAGHDVVVWNRTPGRAAVAGAEVADTLAELGSKCEAVMICINRTEDVEEVIAALRPTLKPGSLVVDHSTISPAAAARIHEELKSYGIRFIDAPITGGSMGAKNGTLTIFCGGEASDIADAQTYLKVYGKRVEQVGGPGKGQMMKMANQIAVGGALLALCECLAFAKKAGLDLAQARELIGGGAAASWAFDNYGPKILNEDWSPGFSVKNQRKDFGYCQEAGAEIGAQTPGTDLVDRLLKILQDEGRGEDTTAALFDVLIREK